MAGHRHALLLLVVVARSSGASARFGPLAFSSLPFPSSPAPSPLCLVSALKSRRPDGRPSLEELERRSQTLRLKVWMAHNKT
eukprot:768305-Hanusia_phi.AAC.1